MYLRKKASGTVTKKKKQKFKSYAEARKDREKFRKKLVELIMHRYAQIGSAHVFHRFLLYYLQTSIMIIDRTTILIHMLCLF